MVRKLSVASLASLVLACATTPTPQQAAPATPNSSAPSAGSANAGTANAAENGPGLPEARPNGAGGQASSGGPDKMCGGIAGIRCPEKQFCAYAPEARCGAGDMSGTCSPLPEACAQLVDEVCGCNDKTYASACMAALAGVSIAMKGACAASSASSIAEGATCGTRGAPGECARPLYCAFKSDCGATDAGGKCSKRPTICTKIYAPVCGCDGKTYGSACTAAAAGMSVARAGACPR